MNHISRYRTAYFIALTALMLSGLLWATQSRAQARSSANSSVDFSGVQGIANWTYGQYPAFTWASFTQLPNWSGFVWHDNQSFNTPFLDANGGHPGVDNLWWAVRRWTAPDGGELVITGDFFDRNTGCGDGAHVRIFQNGSQIYEYLNIPNSSTPYNILTNVAPGDLLDFAIDPIFDAGCDDTHFTANLILNPTHLLVDRPDDPIPSTADSCEDGVPNDCSLRGAINRANADMGTHYTITFDPNLNGVPITLSLAGVNEDGNASGDLDILDDVTILGNGARQTTVSANHIDRTFHITGTVSTTIADLTIQDGFTTGYGGFGSGIYNYDATLQLNRVAIVKNEAQGDIGAGLFNRNGTVTLLQSTVADNHTQLSGGGIVNYAELTDATLTVVNSTISLNTAGNAGGGIANADGMGLSNTAAVTIINSTITRNASGLVGGTTDGGGLASEQFGMGTAVITMSNSIVVDNLSPTIATGDCFVYSGGSIVSDGYNLTGSGTGCPTNAPGDVVTSFPANELSPILSDNGGSTDTHRLIAGGQAINAADNAVCANAPVNNVDQRGVARPQNTVCDMGAFEAWGTQIAAANATDITLSWQGAAAGCSYDIFESMDPYFVLGMTPDYANVTSPYGIANRIGIPGTNYYFITRATCNNGLLLHSNRTGGFNFAITPGTP